VDEPIIQGGRGPNGPFLLVIPVYDDTERRLIWTVTGVLSVTMFTYSLHKHNYISSLQ